MADSGKWKREISAGGVVYTDARSVPRLERRGKKDNGQIFVLLINPRGRDFGPAVDYWTFPKGLIDENENKEEAAVREVKEETGVEGSIKADLSYIKFFRNFDKTLKFVHYFLMEYVSGDLKDHDKEVANADWFLIDEVPSKLKFKTDKEIFEKALASLRGA